jgi:hypothetical protein
MVTHSVKTLLLSMVIIPGRLKVSDIKPIAIEKRIGIIDTI